MSISDVTAEQAKYYAEMCTKFPPPIYRALVINTYMTKVIEVLTAQETVIDAQSDALDALEERVDALEE